MKIKGSAVTGIQCDKCKRTLPEEYTSRWTKRIDGDYCPSCSSDSSEKKEVSLNKFKRKEPA